MTSLSDRPLVSVVTPVLNRAETIRACLASVAAQTYLDIEHIVVDGGSTDETVDIVQRFEAPHRIRVISEPDEGMYDAINKGMRIADGEVLCYLNSDDLYVPWSVECAVRALQDTADMIYGDLGVLLAGPPTSFYLQFYPRFDIAYFTFVASIGQPTVFWRRSLVEKIGQFDTSYRLIGDCEYWLRAAVSGATIEKLDEILAVQVEHPGTLRVTQSRRLYEEFDRMRRDYSVHGQAPRFPKVTRLKKSLFWRKRQLGFWRSLRKREPDRWRRFIEYLRDHDLEPDNKSLALMLLTERLRLKYATWPGVESLSDQLMMKT